MSQKRLQLTTLLPSQDDRHPFLPSLPFIPFFFSSFLRIYFPQTFIIISIISLLLLHHHPPSWYNWTVHSPLFVSWSFWVLIILLLLLFLVPLDSLFFSKSDAELTGSFDWIQIRRRRVPFFRSDLETRFPFHSPHVSLSPPLFVWRGAFWCSSCGCD